MADTRLHVHSDYILGNGSGFGKVGQTVASITRSFEFDSGHGSFLEQQQYLLKYIAKVKIRIRDWAGAFFNSFGKICRAEIQLVRMWSKFYLLLVSQHRNVRLVKLEKNSLLYLLHMVCLNRSCDT